MTKSGKILLIEDDREISSTIYGVLDANGYDVLSAPNGLEGQRLLESHNPDLVITDMMMPRMGGFPVLEFLKGLDSPPKVIMITANEGGRHKAYAEMLGVDDYIRKPFAMEVLLESIDRLLSEIEPKPEEESSSSDDSEGSSKLRKNISRRKASNKKRKPDKG